MALDLRQREPFDFRAMVLIVCEAFENLCATEVGKCFANTFHITAEEKISHDVVDPDASPFDPKVSIVTLRDLSYRAQAIFSNSAGAFGR